MKLEKFYFVSLKKDVLTEALIELGGTRSLMKVDFMDYCRLLIKNHLHQVQVL